jgi:hypothetical protein
MQTPPAKVLTAKYFLLLWLLFFAICFGLGYPTLQRYDPRKVEGLSDTYKYYATTTSADPSVYIFRELFRGRVLVPYVARPFYWFALKFLPTLNAAFFGLLVANSLFCATSACLIVSIGNKLFDLSIGLLGAMLYLLSFAIPNLQLAGLIDSGEACFLVALTWSLLNGRWYLLPLWGLLGALAKETFVPFSFVFSFTWWLVARRQFGNEQSFNERAKLKWIVALALIGLITVSTVHSLLADQLRWPWQVADQARSSVNFFVALWHCVTERSFWLVFGWLLPLGICRFKFFPRPWRAAAIATSVLAILLGAYSNLGGTVGRATFDILGPLLSLSVALLLARPRGRNFAANERG